MKKNNKKGMTLTELIVALMVFAVIAASVTSIMVPILRTYDGANELAESNTLLDNLTAELLSDLADASAISLSGGSITISKYASTVKYDVPTDPTDPNCGFLCRDGTPVLGGAYYKGKTVTVSYVDEARNEITADPMPAKFLVRITVSRGDGTQLATRDYAVSPLGLA